MKIATRLTTCFLFLFIAEYCNAKYLLVDVEDSNGDTFLATPPVTPLFSKCYGGCITYFGGNQCMEMCSCLAPCVDGGETFGQCYDKCPQPKELLPGKTVPVGRSSVDEVLKCAVGLHPDCDACKFAIWPVSIACIATCCTMTAVKPYLP